MSMEQNGNHNMANPSFCKNGCGFYAAPAFDGLCSKCYKELKHDHQSALAAVQSLASSPPVRRSSLLTSVTDEADDSSLDSVSAVLKMNVNSSSNSNNENIKDKVGPGSSSSSPGSQNLDPQAASSTHDQDPSSSSAIGDDDESEGEKGKKPKKNRCAECRKRVGLTGFVCHCGKLLCSLHRYSDSHACTFDFKEKGQEEIRKNNPVVKGEKIQKI